MSAPGRSEMSRRKGREERGIEVLPLSKRGQAGPRKAANASPPCATRPVKIGLLTTEAKSNENGDRHLRRQSPLLFTPRAFYAACFLRRVLFEAKSDLNRGCVP